MQNPYMLLGIRQSATSNEIREALKKKLICIVDMTRA